VTRPNFFIVGAPKSGTTAMHSYLVRHPQIFMSAHKEPHYFGTDLDRTERTPMSEAQYLSLFEEAGDRPVVGEASVFYLYSRRAAAEIAAFAPQARILMMLRCPVDMIYSYHAQRLYGGREDIADFEEALEAEAERKQGRRLPRRVGLRQGLFYRDVGRYAEQVERFLREFPREQVHVILYEQFRDDPAQSFRELLQFLDVDTGFRPDFQVVNPNTVPRSRWFRDFTTRPPRLLNSLARALLPSVAIRRRVGLSLRLLNTRVQRRPPLPGSVRQRLQEEFRDDIRRLEDLLVRDLSVWLD